MIRLPAVAFAVVLFVVPLLTAPIPAVAVPGLIGLLLAAVGIAALWRWPITAAACVFLIDYAAALWVAGASVSVIGAAGFGLSLLFLFQSMEMARCVRHATVNAGVVRSQIVSWTGFGAATLAATMLVMALAGPVAASVPFAAAPLVAAVGALGVVLALAAAVTGTTRGASRQSPDTPST
jgi:hypothetical protein